MLKKYLQMPTKKHIIVIDDESKICLLIKEILEECGYKVDCFLNGYDGIQFIYSNPVDLLILDLYMPGIDGIEVLNRLKNMGIDVPTIILTAWNLDHETKAEIEKDVVSIIDKPVELKRLVELVDEALSVENNIV